MIIKSVPAVVQLAPTVMPELPVYLAVREQHAHLKHSAHIPVMGELRARREWVVQLPAVSGKSLMQAAMEESAMAQTTPGVAGVEQLVR